MKTIYAFILLIFSSASFVRAQENSSHIPLIGEQAPKFTAESTQGTITFPFVSNTKWTIFFSHPADFTSVCSTELLEVAALQDEFEKLNTRIMVISTDAVSSHIEWVKSLESVKYKGRQPMKIKFPIISDKSLEVSKKYGMIHSYSSTTKDVRGVFIISPDNKIQGIFFYPLNVGRNLDEIVRTLTAMQTAEKYTILTPANWNTGNDVLVPSPATTTEAEKMAQKNDPDLYSITWYMWFKKLK